MLTARDSDKGELTSFLKRADGIEFGSGIWLASLYGASGTVAGVIRDKLATDAPFYVFEVVDFRLSRRAAR